MLVEEMPAYGELSIGVEVSLTGQNDANFAEL